MAEIEREHINHDQVISVLDKLTEINRDAQEGYRDAAEHIKDARFCAGLGCMDRFCLYSKWRFCHLV